MHTTLITVAALQALPAHSVAIFDASFDLMKPLAGLAMFREQHIPGAVHADLNQVMSAHAGQTALNGGRHPLPTREAMAQWLGSVGLHNDMQAVVYDRQGANYCGRLWWMLKWCGHANVAVLDGGWQAWLAAGGASATGDAPAPTPSAFALRAPLVHWLSVQDVAKQLGSPAQTLVDARATPRFKGEVEPLDPVAGHIPGALNRPFGMNLDAQGFFKTAAQLRAEFETLLAGRDPRTVVHHCGSGVSAVPNILAMEIAGLGVTPLFAGSWSEWCNTPGLACAQG